MVEPRSSILQFIQQIYPFSDLDDKNLDLLLPHLEHYRIPAGKIIYSPGEESEAFYFILSGKVEIFLPGRSSPKPLQILDSSDHFGEDVLLRRRRHTGAVTKTPVLVLMITRQNIKNVCIESSMIKRIFHLFADTYQNYCKNQFPWRQPSETFYLLLRHHSYFLWIRLIPIILVALGSFAGLLFLAFTSIHGFAVWISFSILALGLGILFSMWQILAWSNQYFALTKDRVLIQKLLVGVFESRQETPMNAILSVGLNTSFLGRTVGFGSVVARAYTGNLAINKLPDPDIVYSFLEYRRKRILADQRRSEKESMQAMLENRLYPEHASNSRPFQPLPEKPSQTNYYSDSFSDLIARLFNLRQEKDGAIIYRTHWWILFKKLFFPNLFLLLVVVIVLSRYAVLFTANATVVYGLALVAAVVGWGWWFYQYTDWHNDVYIITVDQLVDVNRRPLGSEDKKSAPIKNIQTVEYQRNGIIGMALNFGTVKIQIGNEELTFDDVYNPSAIQIEIFNRFREFNEHSHKIEQKRMTDWFTTYDGIRHDEESEN
jgi:hypothetical protein